MLSLPTQSCPPWKASVSAFSLGLTASGTPFLTTMGQKGVGWRLCEPLHFSLTFQWIGCIGCGCWAYPVSMHMGHQTPNYFITPGLGRADWEFVCAKLSDLGWHLTEGSTGTADPCFIQCSWTPHSRVKFKLQQLGASPREELRIWNPRGLTWSRCCQPACLHRLQPWKTLGQNCSGENLLQGWDDYMAQNHRATKYLHPLEEDCFHALFSGVVWKQWHHAYSGLCISTQKS